MDVNCKDFCITVLVLMGNFEIFVRFNLDMYARYT